MIKVVVESSELNIGIKGIDKRLLQLEHKLKRRLILHLHLIWPCWQYYLNKLRCDQFQSDWLNLCPQDFFELQFPHFQPLKKLLYRQTFLDRYPLIPKPQIVPPRLQMGPKSGQK